MKSHQWRPSDALKKRRNNFHAGVDVTGVAALFFFFVFVFMSPFLVTDDLPIHGQVELAASANAVPQPGALKEDAIDLTISRDGSVYLCGTKILPEDLPDQIRKKERAGSDPTIYVRADARAKYGDIATVIGQTRLSGSDHVVLVTGRSITASRN
jgi:biopolymer transport protein ExbD